MKSLRQICDIAALNGLKTYGHSLSAEREGDHLRLEFVENQWVEDIVICNEPAFGDEYTAYANLDEEQIQELERVKRGGISMVASIVFECGDELTAERMKRIVMGEHQEEAAMQFPKKPKIYRDYSIVESLEARRDLLEVKQLSNSATNQKDILKLRFSAGADGVIPHKEMQFINEGLATNVKAYLDRVVTRNRAGHAHSSPNVPEFLQRRA